MQNDDLRNHAIARGETAPLSIEGDVTGMKTGHIGYSIVDSWQFANPVPRPGLDVARAPGLVWLRGEHDDTETISDFLARAQREAADAGFKCIEVSGFININGGINGRPYTEQSER